MKRSAIDCLIRAALATRANAGLIPLALLQSFLVTALFVVSLLPPFLVLGGIALLHGDWSSGTVEDWLAGLDSGLQTVVATSLAPLLLSLVASTIIGLLAILVWGWFQGGMLGVLVAAERQVPAGAESRPGAWRWFRTFTFHDFSGWAGRNAWRFFWFFHLSVTIGLLLTLAAVLVALGAGLGYETWGASAAYGVGCGASLPFLFAVIVYALWNLTAQPAIALPDGGVFAGAGLGLRVVGRRSGAVILVFLAFLVLTVVAWIAVSVVQMGTGLMVPDDTLTWLLVSLVFALIQWVMSSAVAVYAHAAFASLVVSEASEASR